MTRRTDAVAGPLMTWEKSRAFTAAVAPLIREQGLMQAEVGFAMGLGQAAVSRLLQGGGRWREGDAAKAADLLGATVAELLGEAGG